MDYEEITDTLIRKVLINFKLEGAYQEFLDSLVKFNDFKNMSNKRFQEYLDKIEFSKG